MKIDTARPISSITRKIGSRMHDGSRKRLLTLTSTFETTIDDLWDALTSSDRIGSWLLPINGEFRVNGRYQLQGNAGGMILECAAPNRLALTWEFGGNHSWVEVGLFAESAASTLLCLEHIAPVGDEQWKKYGPGAVGVGWDLAFMGLGRYLATRRALDPKAIEAWSGSAEGVQFIRRSSESWAKASIAAGIDAGLANAAAERTSAFYTGTEES